ncbi:hypothetical protein DUZ99_11635 [Xylanibacillus composti]|uniref:Uncharacterized protein n=1 Tax=Xylanibacillus composti TaxID=1572762 RepID=A0A8J4M1D0_9BACL|nr:hypothetical protein [Xylanibacillus composti]MDT9725624.1 hypothetical protein [Xylanibacillus composti]GIQ67717.1 hypothetical protein XYCOK13_05410 [Xylanibacillus composti]
MNAETLWKQMEEAATEEEKLTLGGIVAKEGYTLFYEWLESFKDKIKHYEEAEAEHISRLLKLAEEVIPNPGLISPSWSHIWEQLQRMIAAKNEVLKQVPQTERNGEWQVILDNPYSNDPIVCYPHLSFMEGAYLYGYFRADLLKNEYVRLQKIMTLIQSEN